jgi:hypothetical protein
MIQVEDDKNVEFPAITVCNLNKISKSRFYSAWNLAMNDYKYKDPTVLRTSAESCLKIEDKHAKDVTKGNGQIYIKIFTQLHLIIEKSVSQLEVTENVPFRWQTLL